jgi:hypothetical protein
MKRLGLMLIGLLLFVGCRSIPTAIDLVLDSKLSQEVVMGEVYYEVLPNRVTICVEGEKCEDIFSGAPVEYEEVDEHNGVKTYIVNISALKPEFELRDLMYNNELPRMYPIYAMRTTQTIAHTIYLTGQVDVFVNSTVGVDTLPLLRNVIRERGWELRVERNYFTSLLKSEMFHLTPMGKSKYISPFDIVRGLESVNFVKSVHVVYDFITFPDFKMPLDNNNVVR